MCRNVILPQNLRFCNTLCEEIKLSRNQQLSIDIFRQFVYNNLGTHVPGVHHTVAVASLFYEGSENFFFLPSSKTEGRW